VESSATYNIAVCSLRDSVRQKLHIPRQSDQTNDFDASATDRWPSLSLRIGLVSSRGLSVDESLSVFGTAQVKESPSSADRFADEWP
jgi:hypothetical protein